MQALKVSWLTLVLLVAMAGTSVAAEYWLSAQTFLKPMPDATNVTMWGFAQCETGFTNCGTPSVPGPELIVPVGDTTLTVNLRNDITGPYLEPISLIIPGQTAIMVPVWNDGSTGNRPPGNTTLRVRSFTHEAATGGGTAVYTWNNVKDGTYLYQSGTHPSLQVQMGLHGPMTKDAAAGQAYTPTLENPNTTYVKDVTLVFSDIDPFLHNAIATGTYGTTGPTSMIDYQPKFFLVNGNAYTGASPLIPAGPVGQRTLLRLLNAGYKDYVPMLLGYHMSVIAEDGKLLPFARQAYAPLLPTGKTMDALFTPTKGGKIPLLERGLNLTNAAASPGGMLTYLYSGPNRGDFNADGNFDILWRNQTTGENRVWLMNGTSLTSIVFLLPESSSGWTIVGTGDFNNDGSTDILWRNILSGSNAVWLMNATTRTGIVFLPLESSPGWTIVGTGDFNNDANTDILWRNQTTGLNAVWLMNGTSRTGIVFLPPELSPGWEIVGPK